MGTEVLHPQDSLVNWIKITPIVIHPSPRSRSTTSYRKPQPQPPPRRRSLLKPILSTPKRSASTGDLRRKPHKQVGQVTILRRGESFDWDNEQREKSVPEKIRVSTTTTTTQNDDDSYAGSAFYLSPSPRSLPFPSFFNKKQCSIMGNDNFDDHATKDLRRLLRLE